MTFLEMIQNIHNNLKSGQSAGTYIRDEQGEKRILGEGLCFMDKPLIYEIDVEHVYPDDEVNNGDVEMIRHKTCAPITSNDLIANDWRQLTDKEIEEYQGRVQG